MKGIVKKSSLPDVGEKRALSPAEEVFGVEEVKRYAESVSPACRARQGLSVANCEMAGSAENEYGVLKGMLVTREGIPRIKRNTVILTAKSEEDAMRKGRARTLDLPYKLSRELTDAQLKQYADFIAYDNSMQSVIDRKTAPYKIYKAPEFTQQEIDETRQEQAALQWVVQEFRERILPSGDKLVIKAYKAIALQAGYSLR